MATTLAIGIDIGGTVVKAGVVDVDGRVLETVARETPSTSAVEVEDTIAGVVSDLADRHVVAAVGIGAAGFVDATQTTVLFSPHLAWRNERLQDAVQQRVDLATWIDNDANCAAWAEARFGAGQGEPDLVCVTLGTGIGGGLILDGKLFRGRFGLGGEFGHMQVVEGGHPCPCGNRGCWEQYASANALVREARQRAEAGSASAAALLGRAGGDIAAITGLLVAEAALAGDPLAVQLLAEVGRWLGVGIANLAAALDPGVFVIGGGVADAGDLLLDPAVAAYRGQLTGRGYRPEARIVRARLGNQAGLIGAADLAREALAAQRGRV
ncbi:MAG: ROK family glucokinase [Nocardioidaceae bacterium]